MIKVIRFLAFLLVFSVTEMSAQYKNKAALTSDLNVTSGFNLNAKQKKDYDNLNTKLISDLAINEKTTKSKAERDKGIDRIFDKNEKDLDKLFGNDPNYKKI